MFFVQGALCYLRSACGFEKEPPVGWGGGKEMQTSEQMGALKVEKSRCEVHAVSVSKALTSSYVSLRQFGFPMFYNTWGPGFRD